VAAESPVVSGFLVLPRETKRAIVEHARRTLPHECCGLLIGRGRRVSSVLPAANLAKSARRYELDPRTHIDARRVLRQLVPPLDILGVYHSHPAGPPFPSETDVTQALYREWVHVIVGLAASRPTIAAYRIRDRRVVRVTLVERVPGTGRGR
jgi:proteasome lid subunit RPN8/RPN11